MPLALAMCLSCQQSKEPANVFEDGKRVKIADFQDRRLSDSLLRYFNDDDPAYRRAAAQAFGSVQDTSVVDDIGRLLLNDTDASVRRAAAFALGQTPHTGGVAMLLRALAREENPDAAFEILQAYGRTTARWNLDPAPFLSDSMKTAGLSWSIYRAGLRGKTDAIANQVAKRLLDTAFSQQVRLGAAHFFARGAVDFEDAQQQLITVAAGDASVEVQMAAASALGKIRSDSSLAVLKMILKDGSDPGLLVNTIRAIGSYPFREVRQYLYDALMHKDSNVGIAASEVIIDKLSADDWIEVSSRSNHIRHWRIQANLYEAALKAGKHGDVAEEIKTYYQKATDPYQRAAWLGSLKHYPVAYAFVISELHEADTAVVRSTAASTLVAMNQSPNFDPGLRREFARIFRDLMQTQRDPAVLGTIAIALGDSILGYRDILPDASFLRAAKKRLRLPEHNESLQSIDAAIAWFEGRKAPAIPKNEFNNPIDWDLLKKLRPDPRATIRTSRGNIVIRLLPHESPGTVANFARLAEENYFDGKFFHRVVPNFVIQAGCERGDGWGSENYSIRSEFSPRLYRTGSVGMASAGKDTEGTQWFITHSPTPHLDGRYTIFAEVMEGLEAVNLIQVGDKILDVEIGDFSDQ